MNLDIDTIKQILTLTQNLLIKDHDYLIHDLDNEEKFTYLGTDERYPDVLFFQMYFEDEINMMLMINYKNIDISQTRPCDQGLTRIGWYLNVINLNLLENSDRLQSIIKMFSSTIHKFLRDMYVNSRMTGDDIEIYDKIYHHLYNLKRLTKKVLNLEDEMKLISGSFFSTTDNRSYDNIIEQYEKFVEKLTVEISSYRCQTLKPVFE